MRKAKFCLYKVHIAGLATDWTLGLFVTPLPMLAVRITVLSIHLTGIIMWSEVA